MIYIYIYIYIYTSCLSEHAKRTAHLVNIFLARHMHESHHGSHALHTYTRHVTHILHTCHITPPIHCLHSTSVTSRLTRMSHVTSHITSRHTYIHISMHTLSPDLRKHIERTPHRGHIFGLHPLHESRHVTHYINKSLHTHQSAHTHYTLVSTNTLNAQLVVRIGSTCFHACVTSRHTYTVCMSHDTHVNLHTIHFAQMCAVRRISHVTSHILCMNSWHTCKSPHLSSYSNVQGASHKSRHVTHTP